MQADFRPVPHSVAFALATLSQPSGLTEFIRVYGPERGVDEWEALPRSKDEAEQRERAESTLAEARERAAKNGWDWAEIEAAARQDYPHLFN